MRPEGFEPPAYWFVASCSIQLSYGRTWRLGEAPRHFLKISRGGQGVQPLGEAARRYCAGVVEVGGGCPGMREISPVMSRPVRRRSCWIRTLVRRLASYSTRTCWAASFTRRARMPVDLRHIVERHHGAFGRVLRVAKQDVHRCHGGLMIAAAMQASGQARGRDTPFREIEAGRK